MTDLNHIIAVVLAGGKGKRMKSEMPKVMHLLAGKPIIRHVLNTIAPLHFARTVVVVGHGREMLTKELADSGAEVAVQEQQLGTADAVRSAERFYRDFDGAVLVLLGDVPLLRTESVLHLVEQHRDSPAVVTVLTVMAPDPSGYGRIVRDSDGFVKKIVEHADATSEELQIREINTGIIIFDADALRYSLERIDCNNEQGEYYLTDAVKVLLTEGKRTGAVVVDDYREGLGVNSLNQLEQMEGHFFDTKKR